MWTPEHRRAAERSGLRYPSDMSDAEWALVVPLIPPSKRGGRPRSVNVREVLNAIFYVAMDRLSVESPAEGFPARRARSTITSSFGNGTAPWSASITRSTLRSVSGRDARRARRWRSSTARRRAAPQKGGLARPVGLRCRQEDAGPQAPHSRRHARPPVERLRRCRRCPRSRRCHSTAVPDATPVPVHRAHLCRWRLSGREDGRMPSPRPAPGNSRSSSAPIFIVSSSCPSAGSSSAPLHGSAATAGLPATSNVTPAKPLPSFDWP